MMTYTEKDICSVYGSQEGVHLSNDRGTNISVYGYNAIIVLSYFKAQGWLVGKQGFGRKTKNLPNASKFK